MNNIDACNLALGRIGHGATRPLQSLTEGTEAANACLRVFEPTLLAMLREYVWPWAQVVAPLAAISDVTQELVGWPNLYIYPADCLYLHTLGDSSLDYTQAPFASVRAQFRIVRAAGAGSRVIAATYSDAWAWYTARIEDVSVADETFADALAWRLASELAVGLKADPRLGQWAKQMHDASIQVAAALAGSEAGIGPTRLPDTIGVYGIGADPYGWSRR